MAELKFNICYLVFVLTQMRVDGGKGYLFLYPNVIEDERGQVRDIETVMDMNNKIK